MTEVERLRILSRYIDRRACNALQAGETEDTNFFCDLIEVCAGICTEHGENEILANELAEDLKRWISNQ